MSWAGSYSHFKIRILKVNRTVWLIVTQLMNGIQDHLTPGIMAVLFSFVILFLSHLLSRKKGRKAGKKREKGREGGRKRKMEEREGKKPGLV